MLRRAADKAVARSSVLHEMTSDEATLLRYEADLCAALVYLECVIVYVCVCG